MVHGSCLCGDVRWESTGKLEDMSHCYCSMCRKAHGSAFATYAEVAPDGFRWVSGSEGIRTFQSSSGLSRPFCGRCGSVVAGGWEPEGGSNNVTVPVGNLEGDFEERPLAHIFVASAAPYHEIPDDGVRFDAYPPGYPLPAVDPPAAAETADGQISGSCLCGGVAYTVEGPVQGLVCCHCSRCRRARSAAHGTNGFAAATNVHWIRGEELLKSYAVPDAKMFGQTFCGTCGSPMPRLSHETNFAVIPAGSFDVDPGAREAVHIFWASRAPWYEAPEGLPRFDESPH